MVTCHSCGATYLAWRFSGRGPTECMKCGGQLPGAARKGRTSMMTKERKPARKRTRGRYPGGGRYNAHFSKRLKELREQRTLTIRELGRLAGTSYETISAIELGYHGPSLDVAMRLAAVLRVDLPDLAGPLPAPHTLPVE